jgi:oligoendopeptidase F
MSVVEKIIRPRRTFLSEEFTVSDWNSLKPHFENLLSRELSDIGSLRRWLSDRSELESLISEDMGWRYIKMTCYTDNEEYSARYKDFVENIQPQIAPLADQLNKKMATSPFLVQLEIEPGFKILIRNLKKDIELFRFRGQ